ncbi:unnamed protein product [Cylicocyclus nassatus]|uniref:Uncharacterized protein n=1 Tax=Cylicocyclus nassatus TaxID=53992 RepID=A0AA36MCV6_CYLNA|nr:unnamed protein product [Cylicocyclus nassatus]
MIFRRYSDRRRASEAWRTQQKSSFQKDGFVKYTTDILFVCLILGYCEWIDKVFCAILLIIQYLPRTESEKGQSIARILEILHQCGQKLQTKQQRCAYFPRASIESLGNGRARASSRLWVAALQGLRRPTFLIHFSTT